MRMVPGEIEELVRKSILVNTPEAPAVNDCQLSALLTPPLKSVDCWSKAAPPVMNESITCWAPENVLPPARNAMLLDRSESASKPEVKLVALRLVKPLPLPLNAPRN